MMNREDPIFAAAKDLLCQFKEKLENPNKEIKLNLPKKTRIQIVPGDDSSPWMTCFGEMSDFILIEFPSYSTPYEDNFTKKIKECTILEGNLYDANNPKWIKGNGDKFEVYPWENIAPYTKATPALAMVTLK
jgi:hypothetical protein